LFTARYLNSGNLGEKSVYVYLAVLAGVPCPLCSLSLSAYNKLAVFCGQNSLGTTDLMQS